jgi:hypothetical protein
MNARLRVIIFVLILNSGLSLLAQNAMNITYLSDALTIDGNFEPDKWITAKPATDFLQMQPDVGDAASYKSEVFVGQDDQAIYISATFYYEGNLVASIQNRDNLSESDDCFILLIDSYNDNRSGYGFWINPLGTQAEFRVNDDGRNLDSNWDTEWESAVSILEDRWIIELAIPFSSIRYHRRGETWGINFGRLIRSNFEKSYWSGVLSDDFRMSQGGILNGIVVPDKRSKLTLFPYGTLKLESNEQKGIKNQVKPGFGGDLKWQINPNITTNATINPDFATVEADQERVNLTRYELSYPEKRLFFQEGNEMYDTRIKTFYSRRIQDILYGAKVNGKVGKYNFNAMNVRTLQRDVGDDVPSLFSTVRVKRDFLESSSLGFSAIDKRNELGHASTFSGDYMLNLGKKWKLSGQLVASLPGDFLSHSAWFMRFAHESNVHHVHFRYTELGENFMDNVNQAGFISDDNRREGDADITYRWWLNTPFLRYVNFSSRNNMFWSRTGGTLRSWNFNQGVQLYFENRINLMYNYNNEYKLFDKSYYNHRHFFEVGYNTEEWNHLALDYSFGDNFDRQFSRLTGEGQVKLFNNLSAGYKADYILFSPDTTNSSTFINVVNLHYNFSNNLWIELFGQTRSNTGKFYLYGKLGWRFKPPFGALYLIYTHDQDWVMNTRMDADLFFIKLTLPISVIK